MLHPIRDFDEAMRHNLAVRIVCRRCARESLVSARSLRGWVNPGAGIETVAFRCTACGTRATDVRFCRLFGGRESLTSWTPPEGPAPYD
ncbi:MAG: hypothetical protein ABW179_11835 [Methylobacterium sp.]